MQDLQVVKKDGNMEAWSQDKLIASLGKTGIPNDKATEIGTRVQEWAVANALDGKINSNQVRDKVIEELMTEFPAQADSYKAYKKE
jgi:transcriptional regulator NrdR family protein